MTTVTIPGTGSLGSTFGLASSFNNGANASLATSIAALLLQAQSAGKLNVQSIGGGVSPPPPAIVPGDVNELLIMSGGDYTIPSGWVIIDATSQAVTINGAPNTTVLGGGSQLTLIDPAEVVVGDVNSVTAGANDVLILTAADNGAIAAGNNGNDTISVGGSNDTIQGGTGANVFTATGSNDVIVSQGSGDTINTFGGAATVNSSGSNGNIFGGAGALTVNVSAGKGGEIFGGSGALTVTDSAGGAVLIRGGSGALTVSDTSSVGDTIAAGSGASAITTGGASAEFFGGTGAVALDATVGGGLYFMLDAANVQATFGGGGGITTLVGGTGAETVTAGTGSNVLGFFGTGNLDFIGAGSATLFGGVQGSIDLVSISGGSGPLVFSGVEGGDATIAGGAGGTTLFGAAGQSLTFTNATTSGTMNWVGTGVGSETVNASGATGNLALSAQFVDSVVTVPGGGVSVIGGADMLGGSGNDTLTAGAGNTTMAGGAGTNAFIFDHVVAAGFTYQEFVTDFQSSDTVFLTNYDTASGGAAGSQVAAQKALASATTSGGSTTITLADNTKVTFLGVTSGSQLNGHIISS
jgi:Ca2+-binding RTX toxin-like protein